MPIIWTDGELGSNLTRPGTAAAEGTTDELDISALYAAQRLSLTRLAVLLVDDLASAEDIVQDAFASLHQRQSKLRDSRAALGYLRTSVVNNARSTLRKRQTVRKHLSQATQTNADPADNELLLAAEHQQVLAAVRQLPARQQEVLTLRYWAELSEAEIASTLGISRGAVKSNSSRGIDKLEAILGDTR